MSPSKKGKGNHRHQTSSGVNAFLLKSSSDPITHVNPVPQSHDHGEEAEICFICAEDIRWYAFGKCNHKVCHQCSLRLRALYKNKDCPMCKTELDKVIFTKRHEKDFEVFPSSQMPSDRKLGIYFDDPDIEDETIVLLRFNCPDENCPVFCPSGWGELKAHVRKAHNMLLCELCTRSRKVFCHEHSMYTSETLKRHNLEGDENDPSFRGHPECGFCRQRFYGKDELYEHCTKHHEQCFLCQRAGIRDQYYQNYVALEEHFNKDHFPCLVKECSERKFVVFASELDLKAHELEVHADAKTKARGQKVQLAFEYSGSSSNRGDTSRHNRGARSSPTHEQEHAQRRPVPTHFGASLSTPAPAIQVSSNAPSSPPNTARDVPPGLADFLPKRPPPQPKKADPTPAEAAAAAQQAEGSSSSEITQQFKSVSLSGNPDLVRGLQKLFSSSAEALNEFRTLARAFKAGSIDAGTFLAEYMQIVFKVNLTRSKTQVQAEAGVIWKMLADDLPPESDADVKQAIVSSKKKKKGKGISLAEFESLKKAQPKKDAMIRAWADFRASIDTTWAPVSKTPATAANVLANTASLSNSSTDTRILSIKSKSLKNRNALHFPNSRPASSVITSAVLNDSRALLARESVNSSSNNAVNSEHHIKFAASAPVTPVSVHIPTPTSRNGSKLNIAQAEFPSLPPSQPKPRYFSSSKPTPVNAWGGSMDSGDTHSTDDNTSDKKNNKKGKKVVMRWG